MNHKISDTLSEPLFSSRSLRRGIRAVLLALCMLPGLVPARALAPDFYAAQSRLSQGRWVRVAVTQSGIHCISEAQLRSWGFSNPSAVRVYGYGAMRLPELLNNTYIDDLPQTPSEYVATKGIYFYAIGTTGWNESSSDFFVPVQNPFTTRGYYFLTEDGASDDAERLTPVARPYANQPLSRFDTFYDRLFHEKDLVSPGEAGFLLLGEDFTVKPEQQFQFQLPDLAPSYTVVKTDAAGRPLLNSDGTQQTETVENVRIVFTFAGKITGRGGSVRFSANGTKFPRLSSDSIYAIADHYTHGSMITSRREYDAKSSDLRLGVNFSSRGTVAAANLDYIAVNYRRHLRLPASGSLTVYASGRGKAAMAGGSADVRVWDVTQPASVTATGTWLEADGTLLWDVTSSNRTYVAWTPAGSYPSPTLVETVAPQNIHALPVPDMVIFTPREWRSEAERLANYHRTHGEHPLSVLVLTPQEVYNEFASGSPDVQALRKCLKMFYDRGGGRYGTPPQGEGRLRYALLMGRTTYDPRRLTDKLKAISYPTLPAWFTDRGLNDNDSYTSDDHIAFLEDNSGTNVGRDYLSVALGRMPVTSAADAAAAVDKIFNYVEKAPAGLWRNNIVMLADDKNQGLHMEQTERFCNGLEQTTAQTPGSGAIYKKVYIDEYELVSGTYPEARTQLYRALDEGAMLWTFVGHANPSSLTAEGLVSYTDLNNLYLRHWPMVYFATCDFMRWDSTTLSGAEILFRNADGGVIAAISATRPVYIGDNGYLTESLGAQFFRRDSEGLPLTVGEIYRNMKNYFRNPSGTAAVTSNSNKLRYVLLADPAMRLVYPSNIVQLRRVAGRDVEPVDTARDPALLMARQNTTIEGEVTAPDGTLLADFNGTVSVTLYDADKSVTSHGYSTEDDPGKAVTFDKMGGRLFVGTGKVTGGRFEVKVSMPAEVTDNYRQATFNLYAVADDGRDASGVCRDLYVYGTDHEAAADVNPPVIETIYLNHPTFKDGQQVNTSPMLIATITDDVAINLSTAGVGHQMALYLDDGSRSYTDVAEYFVPFADGTPGGTIHYPLSGIAEGAHSLRLRVWDTAPNSAEATVNFYVSTSVAPTIFDVYTDRNPVSESASFYISHDRPDQQVTVTVEVFDLMGRRVWAQTRSARSDMFSSSPLVWDLCDGGGRRVQRGIYLYRATISDADSGEQTSTQSRKLAVTGF